MARGMGNSLGLMQHGEAANQRRSPNASPKRVDGRNFTRKPRDP